MTSARGTIRLTVAQATVRLTSAAAEGVIDPQVSVFRMVGGAVVTNEVFVKNQVGHEVRCEAVCERGTAMVGRPWGDLYTTSAASGNDGSWGGTVPADFRTRFERAYDVEVQAWVDATRRDEVVGPTAWDGYAATIVCEAGMQSLASGKAVTVTLADRKAPWRRLRHTAPGHHMLVCKNISRDLEEPG